MVNTLSAIALVIALAAPGDTQQVTVSVVAVQATNEGRAAQREEPAAAETKPKRGGAASPFLQQGFAPGLRNKSKPKNENNGDHRYFEAGLESIQDAASTLPYDTFKKLKSETATIGFGKEAQFEINSRYTLRLSPIDRDEQGRVRAKVSIDEHRGGDAKPITALETTSAIAPNKHLVLGGRLPLDEGQLVLFVNAK